MEDYNSKKSFIGLLLTMTESPWTSFYPEECFLHMHRYGHQKVFPLLILNMGSLHPFPTCFTAIVLFLQIVFDYQAAVVYIDTFDRGKGKTHLHLHQTSWSRTFASWP